MGELEELKARVAKLTDILDSVTACNDDCDLAAVLAWVDPSDAKRTHELRDGTKLRVEALTRAIELFCPNVRQALDWAETYVRVAVQSPIDEQKGA
jgi:DNA-binding transcriptional regulator YdaS (Cro superfamily)